MQSKKSVLEAGLERFLTHRILPYIGKGAKAVVTSIRKDLIDIDLRASAPLAELRLDLLEKPAVLHLFTHNHLLDKRLKALFGATKGELESLLRKSIVVDSSYSDALHGVTHSMHLVAKEVEEFRKALTALTKIHHTSGFPKYGYARLPASVKKFEQSIPSSVTLELYRGKVLPKVAMRLHFHDLHDSATQECTLALSPELYREVMGKLKHPLNRLHDGIGNILKKAVQIRYSPL